MELGAGVGLMGYLGDFNESLTKDLQPMGTVLARYNFNPYMGLKMNVSFGKMKGSSADAKTYYPRFATTPYLFNNSLVDVGVAYEYNFLPYLLVEPFRYLIQQLHRYYIQPHTLLQVCKLHDMLYYLKHLP